MGDYDLSPKYEISPRYYGHKTHRREEKIFKCKECKRTFNRRHNLTKHERVHSGDKPYVCKDCGRRFADSSNLTKHINRIHNNIKRHAIFSGKVVTEDKVQNSCEICQRSFNSTNDLFQHELKYANSKLYTCNVCNKIFHLRNSYVRHLDTHNDKRRYHCDICERTFSQKFLLEKHRQCHAPSEHDMALQLDEDYNDDYNDDDDHDEDEDILDINNGDSAAKYESDVEGNQRERIGKGITLHECSICNKVFTYRSLFTRHLKSHSTDNSFKCHLCHQVFKRQYYLVKHRKICKGIVTTSPPGRLNLGVTRDPKSSLNGSQSWM